MGGERRMSSCRVGSPPRGRGKATFWDKVRGKVRITPAQAGKSRSEELWLVLYKDHPRVGGEKTKKIP